MTPRAANQGFTLLEMLVVMGLVGVLTGIGVGFLRRSGGDLDLSLAILRDQVRVAALTARTRHLPSDVLIEPRTDDDGAVIRARVLLPVGEWHMEDRQGLDDDAGIESRVGGEPVPGRFGLARRAGLQESLLSVPTKGSPIFDLREGFALRIDVWIDERAAMTVARLGTSLEFALDDGLYPSVKLVGTEGGGMPGPSVRVEGRTPLRLACWQTLAVVHDLRVLRLMVDGSVVAETAARLPIHQSQSDVFSVSPADAPMSGLVDEVQLLAYELGERRSLPIEIELIAEPRLIRFDRNGDLIGSARFTLQDGDDRRVHRVAPGGVIE